MSHPGSDYNGRMYNTDTITACATASGSAAIAIVRISGPAALHILTTIVRPHRPGPWRVRQVRYGHVLATDGAVIDEVLAYWVRAPHTYTGEDIAEISCHGGAVVVQQVIARVIAAGARLATAGEFTMRAYTAGRIDLTQAEAVMDVISAQTPRALAQAHHQLGGWVRRAVEALRAQVLHELAAVVARIDFPDDVDEIPVTVPVLRAIAAQIESYIARADSGIIQRTGALVALVGRPNVGKSSLLNALLRTERALVSPIAGTTRDTVEETADIAGIPVRFVDTAGIRSDAADLVERMGIERSRAVAERADVVLLLIDRTQPLSPDDHAILAQRGGAPVLVVATKADAPADPATLAALASWHEMPTVAVSVKTPDGIAPLTDALAALLGGDAPAHDERISHVRHVDAFRRAAAALSDAIDGLERGTSAELVAVDLSDAVHALGEITGVESTEALLDVVFSRFCIGK